MEGNCQPSEKVGKFNFNYLVYFDACVLYRNGVVRYESVMMMRNKLDELGKMEGIAEKEKGVYTGCCVSILKSVTCMYCTETRRRVSTVED